MEIRVGSVVGDYEVLDILGAGGVGLVFKARHKIMGRTEAIKVLLPGSVYDPTHAQRFLREVEVQANLAHPNIASVRHAFQFDGNLVMVMEFVDGAALDKILARGRLPLALALNYASQALVALGYAHSRGVVHRDVKPSNMLVTPQGRLKMSDFGLAKRVGDSRLTATQSALGSLFYMSPEQVNGLDRLDERTDIYSMAAVLYELTTGKPPFEQEQPFQLMLAHVETMPRPPHELEPSIPKQLSDIIRKGLEKAPENRHQSAMAFLQAIAELLDLPARPVVRKQPTDALGAQSRFGKQGPGQVINRGETSTNSQEFDDRAESRPHDILPRFLAKVGAKLLRTRSVVAPAAAILVSLGLWAAYSPASKPSSRGIAQEAGSIDLDLSALELPASTATSSGRHELMRRIDPGNVIRVLAISADGSRFAGIGETKAIDVWDAYRGERVASLPSEVTPQGLTISSDGELVAMAYSDGRILLWEASGFRSVEIDGNGPVEAIAFSDDNHLLAVAYPESLDIWEVSDRSRPRQTQHHQLGAQALAFSPSGTTVALASTADSVELVALDTRAKRRTIGVDPGVSTLSFSADGILLAAAGKYGIKVWERDTKESLTSLVPGRYLTVTITPFGRCVALALEDKMAQIWDATVDEQLSTFRHSYKLTAAALSRDGQVAVTASLAGDLWIWRAPAGWDRPQPSESLLKRASHHSNNASGERRAKTTLRRSDSVASHRSSPEQSSFPVLNAKDKEAAIAPPREQPPEDTRGTSERADSEEATAADPQNERAGDGTDQKENPEEKKRNIFRRAIGIFR